MVFGKKFNNEELQETVYDEVFGERVERQGIEELVESVQLMSKQLEMILEEVNKRDMKVEELEKQLEEHEKQLEEYILIIEKLTLDVEDGVKLNREKDNNIKNLNEEVKKQQEIIDKKNAKIKRLEEENQGRFDDNCKLKEEVNGLRQINNELEKKLAGISEFFK